MNTQELLFRRTGAIKLNDQGLTSLDWSINIFKQKPGVYPTTDLRLNLWLSFFRNILI